MTIPTRALSVDLFQVVGTALPLATAVLTLTRADIVKAELGGGLVPAGRTTIQCDANGIGSGPLFPNEDGTLGTQYGVQVFDQYGAQVFPEAPGHMARASMPDRDCALHEVLFTLPPLSRTDADAAVLKARAWAAQDVTPVETVPVVLYSAKHYAEQASVIGAIAADITALAAITDEIVAVAGLAPGDLATVAGIAPDVSVVAGDHTAVVTVAADHAALVAVNASLASVNAVAGSIGAVLSVNASLASVIAVAGDLVNINAVAADQVNIDLAAANLAAINAAPAAANTAIAARDQSLAYLQASQALAAGTRTSEQYFTGAGPWQMVAPVVAVIDVYVGGRKLRRGVDWSASSSPPLVINTSGQFINATEQIDIQYV